MFCRVIQCIDRLTDNNYSTPEWQHLVVPARLKWYVCMYVCSIWKRGYLTAEGQIRDLHGVKRRGAFWDNHMQFTILLQASSSLHLHVQHDEIDAYFRMYYIYDLVNEFVHKKASFTHKKKQGAGLFWVLCESNVFVLNPNQCNENDQNRALLSKPNIGSAKHHTLFSLQIQYHRSLSKNCVNCITIDAWCE